MDRFDQVIPTVYKRSWLAVDLREVAAIVRYSTGTQFYLKSGESFSYNIPDDEVIKLIELFEMRLIKLIELFEMRLM